MQIMATDVSAGNSQWMKIRLPLFFLLNDTRRGLPILEFFCNIDQLLAKRNTDSDRDVRSRAVNGVRRHICDADRCVRSLSRGDGGWSRASNVGQCRAQDATMQIQRTDNERSKYQKIKDHCTEKPPAFHKAFVLFQLPVFFLKVRARLAFLPQACSKVLHACSSVCSMAALGLGRKLRRKFSDSFAKCGGTVVVLVLLRDEDC